jgi:hypothetical protein
MLIDASEDLRQKFAKVCYSPDFEKLRGPYVAETMPVEFGKIENILKSNGTGFLVGSSVRTLLRCRFLGRRRGRPASPSLSPLVVVCGGGDNS